MRRMNSLTNLDASFRHSMADLYTRSAAAGAVAAMAAHLGLGEVRLAGTTPYLTYVVDAPPGPSVDALAAYATLALETSVMIIALSTLPEWRRAPVWSGAPTVLPATDTPGDRNPGGGTPPDAPASAG